MMIRKGVSAALWVGRFYYTSGTSLGSDKIDEALVVAPEIKGYMKRIDTEATSRWGDIRGVVITTELRVIISTLLVKWSYLIHPLQMKGEALLSLI